MSALSAYTAAMERPWLILPEQLETVLAVLAREGDPEALATRLGRPLKNARTVEVRDGVAIVPINGPIVRYANLFTDISGGTSTQVLATDIQTALDDPQIKGVVLDIDSPGGEATGINELAEMIYAARGIKPIRSYIGGTGASAVYWIGTAAGQVIIDETARVGSIGTVTAFRKRGDGSKDRVVEIVSSKSPLKRVDPETDAGRAEVLRVLDDMTEVFIAKVARNMGVDTRVVERDFGQGGIRVGADAVRAGMAHRLGSLESVIAELAGPASNSRRGNTMSGANPPAGKGPVTVRNTTELRAAITAGHVADEITLETVDTAALKAEAATAATAQATTAERERIAAVMDATPAGFEKERDAAIAAGTSAADFALACIKSAKDRGISLAAIQADATTATTTTPPPDGAKKTELKPVSAVYAARNGQAQAK